MTNIERTPTAQAEHDRITAEVQNDVAEHWANFPPEPEVAPTPREIVSDAVGGLACDYSADCKYADRCFTDRHHYYGGHETYKTRIEKKFRSLPENVIDDICRRKHEDYEAEHGHPDKPSVDVMRVVVYESEVQR